MYCAQEKKNEKTIHCGGSRFLVGQWRPRRLPPIATPSAFSDVGWTDITATTAATTFVLEALGYDTDIKVLSVPVTYASLENKDIDIFLGNWMPTMEADIAKYRENGTVDTVRANLKGAKYTLAVPRSTFKKGLKDFAGHFQVS